MSSNDQSVPPRRSLVWRVAWRIGRLVVLFYLVVTLLMVFGENHLVFFPSRYPNGEWDHLNVTPEDAWFNAADGTRLHGWYLEHWQPRAVILYSHGNGGNITDRVDVLRKLHDHCGASVLMYDYRGYGRSEGSPTEAGLYEDGRAARAWLAKRAGIPPEQIVLMGESLGGAVAVDLATDGARGLILQSTFSSAPDVGARHFPWLPVHWLMRNRFDSAAKIGKYHGPLLEYHGDADRTVPLETGQRLFAAANEPKQWLLIPGGDHNDFPPPQVWKAIDEFIGRLK